MTYTNERLIDSVYRNADKIGNRPALALLTAAACNDQPDFVTWSELSRWVNRLAVQLHARGLNDAPLVHCIANTPDDVLIALACQCAGIVEAPIDLAGGESYLKSCRSQIGGWWLDDDTKRDLVAVAKTGRAETRFDCGSDQPAETSNDDDALILFTSGTSGDPKGVVLSHRSLYLNATAKLIAVPQSQTDRRLTVLSIAHAYARTCDLGTWLLSGCTLAIARGFDGWTQNCDHFAPTLCNMVPSLASRILDGGYVPETLRLLGCGGAAMSADQFEKWSERGVTVIQGYGLTESGPVISSQTPTDSLVGHAGRLVTGWEHKIEQQRLFVRGHHLMTRYWGDPESTAQRIDSDGWLDTGDLVRVCESSGQLQILGRCDDRIILSNGHNLDPVTIEKTVMSTPGIRTAVVTRHLDGRSVELWIELEQSASSTPNLDRVLRMLPAWERPRQIKPFVVPDGIRSELFNRKGEVRRSQMLRFIANQSRQPPQHKTDRA